MDVAAHVVELADAGATDRTARIVLAATPRRKLLTMDPARAADIIVDGVRRRRPRVLIGIE